MNKKQHARMKVFQLVDNPYKLENPYISTLIDGISKIASDISWGYGLDNFWKDSIFDYDIIHIHWPDMILASLVRGGTIDIIRDRLEKIKDHGVKLVATCHNLEPHYAKNEENVAIYRIVYSMADVIIHLGEYSRRFLTKMYPDANHVVIYHHTYDMLYTRADRADSIKKLGLNPQKKYILCFGTFRDEEERGMVDFLIDATRKKGVEILAPNYYKIAKRRNIFLMIKQWLKCRIKTLSTSGLHIRGWYVSDELLPYYYGASDISFIQRKKILNSGNLPMAFMMGNVVVGPDTGNVGEILKQTGNPYFNPENDNSLIPAILKGLEMSSKGKGKENEEYSKCHFSTSVIAEQLYHLYKSLGK